MAQAAAPSAFVTDQERSRRPSAWYLHGKVALAQRELNFPAAAADK
jgi:hypothetical protein